jgi:hypothetical protein
MKHASSKAHLAVMQADEDRWCGARFRQKFTLDDAIGSHASSLEANMRVTNGIPLGFPLLLPVGTVNCVQTLKVLRTEPTSQFQTHWRELGKELEAFCCHQRDGRGGTQ